ncbi:Seed maturation protein [Trema orientale]|uniref:Seed maturation protein n=1 Tax=Trema orientale TaxID=63057 RepID=A0A2P5D886_TREOI|nr:Seed maturation protein [Trema orientale]
MSRRAAKEAGSAGGDLAGKPITPGDAAIMQSAEYAMIGKTEKGCATAMMQSAASQNERAGLVGHYDVNDEVLGGDQSISMTEKDTPGRRIITKEVGGQVVGQCSQRAPLAPPSNTTFEGDDMITIDEALEATAMTAGKKPVEWSNKAAIQAAEVRATGRINILSGGVAAAAQSAANLNARTTRDEGKTKLGDVLAVCAKYTTSKLPADRAATRRDAEGVTSAEMRNDTFLTTHPDWNGRFGSGCRALGSIIRRIMIVPNG